MANKLSLLDPFGSIARFEPTRGFAEARAEASYRDGVLELTLPKKAGKPWRKLTVS